MGFEPASAALLPVAPLPRHAPYGRHTRKSTRLSNPTERMFNPVLQKGDELTQASLRNIR